MVVIKDTSDEQSVVRRIGWAGMGWALAPMLGPALGGVLYQVSGWRTIFVILAVLGGAVLLLIWRNLKETSVPATAGRRWLASYRRLLESPRFWAYTTCMACSTGTLYIFLGGSPLVLNDDVGGSSLTLGLYMALVPAGFILGSYLTGLLASRYRRSRTLVGARALTATVLAVGLLLTVTYGLAAPAFFALCLSIGVGNGLTAPVVSTAVMSERADLAGTAAGLSAAMSIGGGALISAVAGYALGGESSVRLLLALLLGSASLALAAAVVAALVDRPSAGSSPRGPGTGA